jgi:hypothetical protein
MWLDGPAGRCPEYFSMQHSLLACPGASRSPATSGRTKGVHLVVTRRPRPAQLLLCTGQRAASAARPASIPRELGGGDVRQAGSAMRARPVRSGALEDRRSWVVTATRTDAPRIQPRRRAPHETKSGAQFPMGSGPGSSGASVFRTGRHCSPIKAKTDCSF